MQQANLKMTNSMRMTRIELFFQFSSGQRGFLEWCVLLLKWP
jgi:hypothetical protein